MVLLYVGAVLVINGIWLMAAQAAAPRPRRGRVGRGDPRRLAGRTPFFIQGREVAVINIFTGFVGVVARGRSADPGNREDDIASVRGARLHPAVRLHLPVGGVQPFLNAGGRAFGWYCLFVAITAVPAGIYTLRQRGRQRRLDLSRDRLVRLGDPVVMFFVLLALDRPIARLAGGLAIIEGIGTAWVLGMLLLLDQLAF